MRPSLANLRFPVERSRGRRYPEPPHPYRNEFQRDRDRIVHSRAFRRLEDKTQVFGAGMSDHFRNRLTHTIEVSQIARTVAAVLELDEDFTEALALAHDIGHPPFAHAGEEELDRLMQAFGDRFEHNLHALRIVETFEQRYARFPGLNLTFEVREGIVKHSRDLEPGTAPELEEYLPGLRPPLEAQLIDLADEIAYNTADLDDGFAAGLFTLEQLAAASPGCARVLEETEMQFPGAPERIRFHEALRRWIDLLVSGLIEGTFTSAMEAGVRDPDEVRAHPQRLAGFNVAALALTRELKQFLHRHVYFTASVMEERRRSRAMLAAVFHHFLDHPEDLPEPHRERMAQQPPHRVVCDYIAGMTDGFLRRTYQRLVAAGA
ncbi:MAG: deoxyguanosinetriphosphate triphosphohydrolase [Bryobacterales bacterium]|nr:deoxyguanosinetriphosphate triphosphohydrolase [Bryobacteraceae bacterium]MDW8354897.1 deoxyguanosinetriphosphate triphosphohydrolase [Bryobacterales bacterium]